MRIFSRKGKDDKEYVQEGLKGIKELKCPTSAKSM